MTLARVRETWAKGVFPIFHSRRVAVIGNSA